jgi:MATE family multidrug resistance protein
MAAISALQAPSGAFRFWPAQTRVRLWRGELGTLLAAASPIVLIGILGMAMSIADVVMLGRFDPEGLATTVVVSDLYSIIFNFSAGFAGVVTPQVATALGARVRWQVCTIVRRTLLLVLMLGIAGATLILCSSWLLAAAGVQQSATGGAYAACMAGTYLFMVLFALVRAVLSAMGRPGAAMLAISAALPVKICANYIFISGAWGMPALGATGAGLASFLVAVLMGGSLLSYLWFSKSFAEFDYLPEDAFEMPSTFVIPGARVLAASGALLGLTAVAETGVFLASTIVVGMFAASDLIAHALAFRALATGYLLIAAIGQAVTMRVAYLAARSARGLERHAVQAIVCFGLALIAVILLVMVAAAAPLGRFLASTIDGGGHLAAPTADLLRIAGLTLAALVPAHMITALLRARQRVGIPTGVLLVCYWGLALGGMLLACKAGFGAWGTWTSLLLGAVASSLVFAVYFVRTTSAERSFSQA